MEGTNHGGGDNEMDGIVMEIQSMVDQHAAYFVAKGDIKVQMEAMPNSDRGDNDNGGNDIPKNHQRRDQSSFHTPTRASPDTSHWNTTHRAQRTQVQTRETKYP